MMVTAWALARRFWWGGPILGLLVALHLTRVTLADRTATLTAERAAWSAEIARADRLRVETERRWADQQSSALATYSTALASREPLILKSTDIVREYAQTPAGRVLCRDADRVRAIDALDRDLADPAGATGSGGGTVRADATASPAGR